MALRPLHDDGGARFRNRCSRSFATQIHSRCACFLLPAPSVGTLSARDALLFARARPRVLPQRSSRSCHPARWAYRDASRALCVTSLVHPRPRKAALVLLSTTGLETTHAPAADETRTNCDEGAFAGNTQRQLPG